MIKEDINTNDLFIPIGIDHEFLTFFPSYNLTSFDNYRKIESYIKQNNFSNDSELFRNLFESDFLTNFIASFSSDCSFNCKTRINFIINISDESIINSNMEKQINVFIKNNSQVNFYLFVNTKDQLNDNFIKFKIYNITVYKYRYDINKTIYFSLILNIKKIAIVKSFDLCKPNDYFSLLGFSNMQETFGRLSVSNCMFIKPTEKFYDIINRKYDNYNNLRLFFVFFTFIPPQRKQLTIQISYDFNLQFSRTYIYNPSILLRDEHSFDFAYDNHCIKLPLANKPNDLLRIDILNCISLKELCFSEDTRNLSICLHHIYLGEEIDD